MRDQQLRAPRRRSVILRGLNRRLPQEPANPPVNGWEPRYRRYVITSDVLVTLLTAIGIGGLVSVDGAALFKDLTLGFLSVITVICSLAMNRAWHPTVLGQGADEYVRLGRGMFAGAVALALAGLATGVVSTRPWVFIVIPSTAVVALGFRYLLRQVLHRARYEGECLLPVMAAGSIDTVRDLIKRTKDAPHVGWRVDAVCTVNGVGDSGRDGMEVEGVSVIGTSRRRSPTTSAAAATASSRSPPTTTGHPAALQRLAWQLEGSGAEMVVAPTLMEVAGPRLHVSGVLGMPLLRVSAPAFTGMRRVVKGVVDRIGAFVLITLGLPFMLVAAAAIAVDSRGSMFYTQRRVGKDGGEFTILKFRTMVRDADQRKKALADANEGAGVLFKMRRDPRVTRVGSLLRRYSIDELPQLFNVLTGVDVARRAAAAAAGGERPLRAGRAAPAAGQTGLDRVVAGQRT